MTTRWLHASASAMAAGIREGEVTSEALIEAHITQIEAVNPTLNAVVQLTASTARRQAQEADQLRAKGEYWGPLHGVPMTLKDSLDTAGVTTTGGLDTAQQRIPRKDATVVQRLKAAGAILLGKTNTPALTLSFETDNDVYGRTNNPYDVKRTPGGSSGGAAAIIAAAGSPFDIGSDTGGSIRQPAHNCGIAGLKPTSGRVPRTGHLISFDGHIEALTQLGPMARYVEDLALLMPIIAGSDGIDPSIVPMPWTSSDDITTQGLRIAWHTSNGEATARPDVCNAMKEVLTALSDRGLELTETCPPQAALAPALFDSLFEIDGYAWVGRIKQRMGDKRRASRDGHTAKTMTSLIETWQLYRSQMLQFAQQYDAILSPPFTHPALEHNGIFREELGVGYGFLNLYNILGWPAVVVRAGTSDEGLPLGIQIAARPWREDVALAIAAMVEEHSGGWQPPSM